MDKKSLNEQEVEGKYKNWIRDKGNFSCVTWITFPFNKNNLKIVEDSLKKNKMKNEDYNINYKENIIGKFFIFFILL